MGTKFLIDTSVVVKYLQEELTSSAMSFMDKVMETDNRISFISKIELLVWKPSGYEDIKIRETYIKQTEIEYIDDSIINKAIYFRKETNIKLPDAVIAATAACCGYTLISTNDNDFLKVKPYGLKYLNPEKGIED
jgi:predicted nucleic acid-binding protein